MSQNQRPNQSPKEKLAPKPEDTIIINQPMVRNFSTGGGHGPEDTLVEGDSKIATKKWQGYPPKDLNIVGKPQPPMPEVAIPRFTGKAQYATRILLPNMLFAKIVTSPHPRATVKSIDVTVAEKMAGVRYILTSQNAPKTYPLPEELFFQGEVVAIVAAETEDQAEDAIEAIQVEYNVLPFASTLAQVMAPNAPQLRNRPNMSTSMSQWGDVDKAFAEADVVKEFTYVYGSGIPIPMQPTGCVAKWDGDRVTIYGMSQGIYPQRDAAAMRLGIAPEKVHYINKWNGGTFGGARRANEKFYPWIAHIAKEVNRPVKLTLGKDQELAHCEVKPQNLQKFKVGAMKDGRIIACQREFHVNVGANPGAGGSAGRSELYLHVIPNWKEIGFIYRSNSMMTGPSRSNSQQEFKWGWEQMMDEMAEAVGMDPVKFRLLNVQKPGTKVALGQGGPTISPMPETENGVLVYDSYASVEVLEEGVKAIGWDRRNATPGGNQGRFKRGFGIAMSQHHAGRVGYHEGEIGFERVIASARGGGGDDGADVYSAELELTAEGNVVLHFAQPDSGTNHGTSMAMQVAEILGYLDLSRIRLIWGDSDLAPSAPGWNSGLTTQLQGGALCNAADKLRKDLVSRAATRLKVDAATLQIRNGVISSKDDPRKRITFAELARLNNGTIRQMGRCVHPGSIGRAMNRGIGACFAEVEVDTWTGDYRYIRAAYCHDSGNIMNPLLGSADMHGSLVQSTQVATDAIPWDREFPGTRHYAVGFLSFRLPTIMDVPDQVNVFINSLEPRWFFGSKGFAETSIGAPPGALANAIYNACGVRIREHPITREKIIAGLKEKQARG
jgi:xanthine dehydrogenase YagR molybdenum-binding subunit